MQFLTLTKMLPCKYKDGWGGGSKILQLKKGRASQKKKLQTTLRVKNSYPQHLLMNGPYSCL